jgi:Flp pilus assembly pilin Flp
MKVYLKGFWTRFLNDERGQSTTEYILILSVVVMIAMKFKSLFSTSMMTAIGNLGTQIDGATTQSN